MTTPVGTSLGILAFRCIRQFILHTAYAQGETSAAAFYYICTSSSSLFPALFPELDFVEKDPLVIKPPPPRRPGQDQLLSSECGFREFFLDSTFLPAWLLRVCRVALAIVLEELGQGQGPPSHPDLTDWRSTLRPT